MTARTNASWRMFDAAFTFIAEHRAHIAEWLGEDAYFEMFKVVPFRCPVIPSD